MSMLMSIGVAWAFLTLLVLVLMAALGRAAHDGDESLAALSAEDDGVRAGGLRARRSATLRPSHGSLRN